MHIPRTVHTHKTHYLTHLGVPSKAGSTRYSRQKGGLAFRNKLAAELVGEECILRASLLATYPSQPTSVGTRHLLYKGRYPIIWPGTRWISLFPIPHAWPVPRHFLPAAARRLRGDRQVAIDRPLLISALWRRDWAGDLGAVL